MKLKLHLLLAFLTTGSLLYGQYWAQYFDGADTNYTQNSIRVYRSDDSTNIWQIGPPQKLNFDSAATLPNALVTDTLNTYPPNNRSQVQFSIKPFTNWGILAIQWKQKLDMDSAADAGFVEFSVDSGTTWQNPFNSATVYNFYGFLNSNKAFFDSTGLAFTGVDTVWRDIWLCYNMAWVSQFDSMIIRFTFVSDSVDNSKEGWLIDNLNAHMTFIHTVSEVKEEKYLKVFPNPANEVVHVEARKLNDFHIIEYMTLTNADGKLVAQWRNIPTKYFFDTGKYANGNYTLKVKTNIQTETIPIVIKHE